MCKRVAVADLEDIRRLCSPRDCDLYMVSIDACNTFDLYSFGSWAIGCDDNDAKSSDWSCIRRLSSGSRCAGAVVCLLGPP